jgi:hypothetical protein
MKTSLLVLSMLMASTNAIDIQAAPAAVPHDAAKVAALKDADPVAAKKAPAAPHVVDHKVDTPEHHVVAKGHADIKKAAAAAKAPVVKDDDDDVAKADDKAAKPETTKCMTNSCKAARAIKKLDAKKDDAKVPKPDAVVKVDDKDEEPAHEAKPKMVVVHKAEAKKAPAAKPEAHKVHVAIKTRPAKHHDDPTTKAH